MTLLTIGRGEFYVSDNVEFFRFNKENRDNATIDYYAARDEFASHVVVYVYS